jgi:MscS family membrane protein
LIGTIVIFRDKPFHIGDWVEAGEVSGAKETVGFRSTSIRSGDTSAYQIPKSKLSEIIINNKSLRLFRRYNTNLGLRYDTPPALIEAFVRGVRETVIGHPETRSESYNAEFTGFGDSALGVMINGCFKSSACNIKQSFKRRLHIAIVKLAKELVVDFAFSSSTVAIENFLQKKGLSSNYNIYKYRTNFGIAIGLEEFNSINLNSETIRNNS